jgi:hypothetical protein
MDPNNFNSEINPTISYHDIIRQLEPAVIPRVTSIANLGWCERAAYDVAFFGVDGYSETNMGVIGSAMHRIVIKSILEIVQSLKSGQNNITTKEDAKQIFDSNTEQDIDINWKTYALAGIENPIPLIMQDLNIRADRLADKLIGNVSGASSDDGVDGYYQKIYGLIRTRYAK